MPEALNPKLLQDAKKLIFKAEEARAKTYYPSRLNQLKENLKNVYNVMETDPDKAREILSKIETDANKLIRDSLEALKIACINILESQTHLLLEINADKYTKTEYEITQENRATAIESFESGNFTKSLADYRIAYTSLTNLYNSVSKNMEYINSLIKSIKSYKTEGDALDVKQWAKEEYIMALDSYKIASDLLYKQFDAINGEKALLDTIFYAKKSISQAKININIAQIDSEIFNLMSELEDASTLTVLDEEDNIISPKKWDGQADLIEKPIEANVEKDTESGLTSVDLDKNVEVDYPIIEGTTQVLGIRERRKSLLEEAKDLWSQGIEARNNGDLELANEYLAKSKVYLDEYKSMAVDYIYTVILNEEKRDCLWRISEKDEYYGDPLLWKSIWERNKKLIQDPDLIYPGWKLIIPPID